VHGQGPADASHFRHLIDLPAFPKPAHGHVVAALAGVELRGPARAGRLGRNDLRAVCPCLVQFVQEEIGERAEELARAELEDSLRLGVVHGCGP